jgi:transposase
MAKKRRNHTNEFKVQAIKMVTEQGLSYAEAGRRLGINSNLLSRWKKQLDTQGKHAFPGHGKRTPVDAEIERLRAENQALKRECDLLKKATAYFAKELL